MKNPLPVSLLFFCTLSGGSLFADVVTLKDGSQLSGATTGTAREIRVKTADGVRSVAIDQVQSIRFEMAANVPPAPPQEPAFAPLPAPVAVNDVTLPAGTEITIRTIDAIDSKTGDTYREYAASLDEPLVVDQVTIAPAKSNAVLKIAEIKQAGKLKGSTTLSLHLIAVTINDQRVALDTSDVVSASTGKGKTTARNGAIGNRGWMRNWGWAIVGGADWLRSRRGDRRGAGSWVVGVYGKDCENRAGDAAHV